jgi:hypothetical protein
MMTIFRLAAAFVVGGILADIAMTLLRAARANMWKLRRRRLRRCWRTCRKAVFEAFVVAVLTLVVVLAERGAP